MKHKLSEQETLAKLTETSPSFCLAKWYNATVWLGSGMTSSCHHPPAHKIDLESLAQNPKLLHNTVEKKQQRKEMLEGIRPKGCEYCWRIEDTQTDTFSDRIYKSKIYNVDSFLEVANTAVNDDVNLKTLEIAFDRTCNFACSYCSPIFSSTWANDIKLNGHYNNLLSDHKDHYTHEHKTSQLYSLNESNPYVDAFFKWWESDLQYTLEELRITGGEPLMSPHFWRLVEWFKDNNTRSNMRFAVNSNLGAKDDLIDQLVQITHSIPNFHLYTSCEAVTDHAEYIRDGLSWDNYNKNIYKILQNGNVSKFYVMSTISALCLETLPNFLDEIIKLKSQFGKDKISISLNILSAPDFHSVLVLPESIRKEYQIVLLDWLNKNENYLYQYEINQIKRLTTYLIDANISNVKQLEHDFKQFYTQYDRRRNKDFISTFPKLRNWYEGIV